MPRVDVWDVAPEPVAEEPLWCGFPKAKLEDKYELGRQLGSGGFGSVRMVVDRGSGKELAAKSIAKRLNVPNVSPKKQEQHLENIRREALILRKLRGTLNVVHLEDVFEDEEEVHLVQELCKGGELVHRIKSKHYSERTAASYMRAVLRTLAQCHHLRVLHRDIKPGNFMLLTEADNAPVKAIDFGLAVFFDPKKLPRTDLGLEGTPHFMAPEQLSGKTEPASDIWAAGVMAHQLLSGNMPFEDWKNPKAPSLSLVWRSILTEEPKMSGRSWEGISEQAKDFVRSLLVKDPKERPTAKQALSHPWLQGKSVERNLGKPLARTVVQRLQKFGVESLLKRTVLDMIANDLINRHMEQLRTQKAVTAAGAGPGGGGAAAASAAGETGEATPEGAAAAATHRTPPAASADAVAVAGGGSGGAAAAAAFAANSAQRWRQLAAQDLLMQTAHKAATVHAGGEALAALRRLGHGAGGGAGGGAANREGSAHAPGSQRRSHDVTPSGAVRPFALTRATTFGTLSCTQGQAELAPASPAEQMQARQRHNDPIAMETGLAGGSPPLPLPLLRSSSGRLGGGSIPPANILSPPVPGVPGLRSTSYQRLTAAAAAAYAGSNGSIHGGGSGSIAAAAGGGSAHGGGLSPLAPAGGSGGRLGTVAAAAAAAAGSGYKGPVKDTAAAAAWDMNFMASKLAAEGSGHALQHYAWLLNMGERSLHGVIERSYHGGRHHTPAAEPVLAPAGGSEPHPAFASSERHSNHAGAVPIPGSAARRHAPGSAVVGSLGAAGPLGAAPRSLGVGSVPGFLGMGLASGGSPGPADAPHGEGDGYLRMLSLVARQRAEHRKVQRLALDTSGHRQTHYQELLRKERGEAAMDTPEEGDEAAEDDGASSAAPSTGTTGTWSAHVTQHNSAAALPSPRELQQQQQQQDKSPPQQQHQQQQPTAVRSTPFAASAPAAATPAASSGGGAPGGGSISRNDTPSLIDIANAAAASLANPLFASPYAHPLLPTPTSTPPQPQLLPPSTGHPLLPTPNSTPPQPQLQQQPQPQSQPQQKPASVGIPGLREVEEQEGKAVEGPVGVGRRASEGGRSCSSGGGVGSHGAEEHHYQHEHESLLALAEAELEGREGAEAADGAGQAEEGRRGSLLNKVRKALMKPVKNLLSNAAGNSTTSSSKSLATSSTAPGSRTPGGLSRRSLGPAAALLQEGGEGGGGGSLARASLAALPVTEERGRGRGAYAAFLQQSGTGTNTPQDRSGHGGQEATAGGANASSTAPGAAPGAAAAPAEKAALPFPAGFAIHTVKAHKQQDQEAQDRDAAADAGGRSAIALETERGPTTPTHEAPPAAPVLVLPRDDAPAGPGAGPIAAAATGPSALAAGGPFALASRLPDSSASPSAGQGVQNPTNHGKLKQGELVSVLGMLLGDNTCQGAELHDVLRRLQFDAADSEEEVTFEQLSEGLQRLGYRLEPGELEDLLRQVGVGSSEGLTASQFIASQVDWRAFSVNHRAEWLHCLRKAFEELGGGAGPDGRVSLDTLLGSLTDKLPEEEVNLAVQESLMDAAVEADAVDFESFVRLMRCNSNDSLQSMGSSELSYDLYDPRIKDPSVHGPGHGEGLHAYHPALETVPDSDAADD